MTPAQAAAMYARQIGANGESVTFSRAGANERTIRVRVTGYSPAEIASGIGVGDRKVIALATDFVDDPPAKGDEVALADETVLYVESVDSSTRRVAGVTIAYELRATGA